jgi:hypothetical protein
MCTYEGCGEQVPHIKKVRYDVNLAGHTIKGTIYCKESHIVIE